MVLIISSPNPSDGRATAFRGRSELHRHQFLQLMKKPSQCHAGQPHQHRALPGLFSPCLISQDEPPLGDDIAGPEHGTTHCSTDAPAQFVQSPAGTSFIDTFFLVKMVGKGIESRGPSTPASFLSIHIGDCLHQAG